jgi:DNA-binding beta-propeller fold protein YncE
MRSGKRLYLAEQTSGVMVLNTKTLGKIGTISNATLRTHFPGAVAVTPNGTQVCVLTGEDMGFLQRGPTKLWIVGTVGSG